MSKDADNGPDHGDDVLELFGLFAEDKLIVEQLSNSVRRLLKRDGTTPEQTFHLAKLLHGFERLALATKGICIELSLGIRHENDEVKCQEITLDDSSFRLSTGAWIIVDPSIGGDSQDENVFEVQVGGFREMAKPAPMVVMDWLDAFDGRASGADQELRVSDSADSSEIDWEAESGKTHWDNPASDYT
jgi:hypothetical protein